MPTDTENLALDGDALTRWAPLESQRPGQILELDRLMTGLSLLRLASRRQDGQPRCL